MNVLENAQKEEKVIVLDLQTGDFSAHTSLEGIFEFCLEDLVAHCWRDDLEMIKSEYANPSVEKKKELVEQYEYQLLNPTPKLVREWEAYHNRSFFSGEHLPKWYVTETQFALSSKSDFDKLQLLIDDQLEEYGFNGSELTEKFGLVDYCYDNGIAYVDFITDHATQEELDSSVTKFLEELMKDLKAGEHCPHLEVPASLDAYSIIRTRPYRV